MTRIIIANHDRWWLGKEFAALSGDNPLLRDIGDDLRPTDVVLTIGLGRWFQWLPLAELKRAGVVGATRVHWQVEPLLPVFHSALANRLARRFVGQNPEPHGLVFARDVLQREILRLVARGEPWRPQSVSGRTFSFPMQQTRALRHFWSEGYFDRVIVSVPGRATSLAELGIPAAFVPVGSLESHGRLLDDVERDIDVLFLGKVNTRRRHILPRIEAELARAGRTLHVVERSYGEDRTRLLNRARIIINVHKFPWDFPGMRMLMAARCGVLVVSETAPDTRPWVAGEHFVAAPESELGATILRYLDDEPERQRLTAGARRLVDTQLSARAMIDGIRAQAREPVHAG